MFKIYIFRFRYVLGKNVMIALVLKYARFQKESNLINCIYFTHYYKKNDLKELQMHIIIFY